MPKAEKALKETVKERLSPSTIMGEVMEAVGKKIEQGSLEVVSALYTGSGFVQYGAQDSVSAPAVEVAEEQQQQPEPAKEVQQKRLSF